MSENTAFMSKEDAMQARLSASVKGAAIRIEDSQSGAVLFIPRTGTDAWQAMLSDLTYSDESGVGVPGLINPKAP